MTNDLPDRAGAMSEFGVRAVHQWYCAHHHAEPTVDDVSIDEVDDEWLWVTLNLDSTGIRGQPLAPLVDDRGSGIWFQAWSDGHRMTISGSCRGLAAAAEYLDTVFPAPASGDGEDRLAH